METSWNSFPTDDLSRKSLTSIIQLLLEDLRIANEEIVRLKKTNGISCHDNLGTDQLPKNNLRENPVMCNWVSLDNPLLEPLKQNDPLDQNNLTAPIFPKFTTPDVDELHCGFCSTTHKRGKENCPAWNKLCRKCHRPNHFSKVCKTKPENCLKRNRSKASFKESIHIGGTSNTSNDENDQPSLLKLEKCRTFRRHKSESDLRTLGNSISNDVACVRKDKHVANDIPRDPQAKYRQENETNLWPCLWCSRKTKYRCSKCARVYCSRRCTFSDSMHSNDCNYGYFCAHCAENGGYCDIHKAPSEKFQENEPEPDDEK